METIGVNRQERVPLKLAELMSRIDAAAYLGIKPQTLAVWSCNRRYGIPMIKIGRLAKYRRSDLDAFIAARTVGSLNES